MNERNLATLYREATERRIDWHAPSGLFGDWKALIGHRTRSVWYSLSDEAKRALAEDAYERARDADELAFEAMRS